MRILDKKEFGEEKVIGTVAKDYLIRGGSISVPKFGIDKVIQCIYEGRL